MPESYTPTKSGWTVTVPSDADIADGPKAFKDFADDIPAVDAGPLTVQQAIDDLTLVQGDEGSVIAVDCVKAKVTVTVPSDATTNFDIGTAIAISNVSVTPDRIIAIKGASGVTVNNKMEFEVKRFKTSVILKYAANEWLIVAGNEAVTP